MPRACSLLMPCVTLRERSFEYQEFMIALNPSCIPAEALLPSRLES